MELDDSLSLQSPLIIIVVWITRGVCVCVRALLDGRRRFIHFSRAFIAHENNKQQHWRVPVHQTEISIFRCCLFALSLVSDSDCCCPLLVPGYSHSYMSLALGSRVSYGKLVGKIFTNFTVWFTFIRFAQPQQRASGQEHGTPNYEYFQFLSKWKYLWRGTRTVLWRSGGGGSETITFMVFVGFNFRSWCRQVRLFAEASSFPAYETSAAITCVWHDGSHDNDPHTNTKWRYITSSSAISIFHFTQFGLGVERGRIHDFTCSVQCRLSSLVTTRFSFLLFSDRKKLCENNNVSCVFLGVEVQCCAVPLYQTMQHAIKRNV